MSSIFVDFTDSESKNIQYLMIVCLHYTEHFQVVMAKDLCESIKLSDVDTNTSDEDDDPIICSVKSLLPPFSSCYVRVSDYMHLKEGVWLNDVLIEFCLFKLLELADKDVLDRLQLFSSFAYTKICNSETSSISVMDWARRKKIDLFSKNVHIFPINLNGHWYLLVVFFTSESEAYESFFAILDSSCKTTTTHNEVVNTIKNFLFEEMKINVKNMAVYYPCVPQQSDSSSCGLYVIHFFREILNILHRKSNIVSHFQEKIKWPENKVERSGIAAMIKEKARLFDLDRLLPSIDFTDTAEDVSENVKISATEVTNRNRYEQYFFDLIDNHEDYTTFWKYK